MSPEQSGYASTPGAAPIVGNVPAPATASFDYGRDARLVNITEETWGFEDASCSSYKANHDLSELCPALSEGYLMKRAGVRDEDGLVNLHVRILHSTKSSNGLLKEILEMYGRLGTLARIRKIVDPVRSILPWHLAVAKKSYIALKVMKTWEGD